ncbi:MAG: hypothetical protein M3Z23_11000 [Acidobacteriota bacterium]|nr:hypothetical protein [Acidobacteriota bacterium]
MERQIPRQEAWRLQYRNEPYLRDLSNDDLFVRAGALMTAVTQHSEDGKLAIVSIDKDWSPMERFTHALEEFAIRRVGHREPAVIKAMHIPQPNSSKVKRAPKILSKNTWSDPIMVKFGTRKHIASLFLEGKGRISLARTYKDSSLGHARADDESQISVYVHPMDAHRLRAVEHFENGSRGIDVQVPYLGSVQIQWRANSDFYVYCLAQSCDVRMFDDFTTADSDVDTCVVITEPHKFMERIKTAIAIQLPNWKPIDGPITYLDPFFVRVEHLPPQFCKHFRFSYQKEHRLVWIPPNPEQASFPDHIYFDIGPLTDCARLIWL